MSLTVEQYMQLFALTADKKAEDMQSFFIDGTEIEYFSSYTFYYAKLYVKTPARSSDGTIDNLDSYATFLVPRLKIRFAMMSMPAYRQLTTIMRSKNEFTITCYDPVSQSMVTHNMYFSPDDYPEFFTYDLHLLGAMNYEIELQGTNTDTENISITYHRNPPSGYGNDATVGTEQYPYGYWITVGTEADTGFKTIAGWTFAGWNTMPDGSGTEYLDGQSYQFTEDVLLYAQWRSSSKFILSYDYGRARNNPSRATSIEQIYRAKYKVPAYDSAYDGDVTIEYHGVPYTIYRRKGWFTAPVGLEEQRVTNTTTYNVHGNSTIYQVYEITTATLSIYDNIDNSNPKYEYVREANTSIVNLKPQNPTRSGYRFIGWYTTFNGGEFAFTFDKMPPCDTVVYAKWQRI